MEHQGHDLLDQDTTHFTRIFPVEIWKMITTRLNCAKHFCNSSPFCRNLLASGRTLSLFQKILRPLTSTVWEYEDTLSVKDVLRCRKVCKVWNKAVDSFIREACEYSTEMDSVKEILRPRISYGFWHDQPDDPKCIVFNFLQHFEPTHPGEQDLRSPFIWPKILLTIPAFSDYNDEIAEALKTYFEGVTTMLKKYGKHVIELKFEIFSSWFDLEYAVYFQKWLVFMPNLIHLGIRDRTTELDISQQDLQAFFLATPFPIISSLESIKVHSFRAPLFNNLIKQNNHIYVLDVKEGNGEYDFFDFPMSNLDELKIEFSKESKRIHEKLNFPLVQWPLTTLSISMAYVPNFSGCKECFEVIQSKFANTLENLTFKLPKAWNVSEKTAWQTFSDISLCLPQLITINLATCVPISLDFLLPMKNNLHFIFVNACYALPATRPKSKRAIVEFYGYESGKKIKDSNIWTHFEKLLKIEIRRGSRGTKYFHRRNKEN